MNSYFEKRHPYVKSHPVVGFFSPGRLVITISILFFHLITVAAVLFKTCLQTNAKRVCPKPSAAQNRSEIDTFSGCYYYYIVPRRSSASATIYALRLASCECNSAV